MRQLNTFLKLTKWLLIARGAVAKSLKTLILFPEVLVPMSSTHTGLDCVKNRQCK